MSADGGLLPGGRWLVCPHGCGWRVLVARPERLPGESMRAAWRDAEREHQGVLRAHVAGHDHTGGPR